VADKLDCVVIGAGVIGLAIARALAMSGREVVVLEGEAQVGTHSSSRNSEVIHAGIYYPEKSLKARLCVRGKQMLYDFCVERSVAHQHIGKLIVASNTGDLDKLRELQQQAEANGVGDLRIVDADTARELEPNVDSVGALLSPSTGIVDSHGLMSALQADVEAHGGVVLVNSLVTDINASDDGFEFDVGGAAFACRSLVNSAGLGAVAVAPSSAPTVRFAKGHYFEYQGTSPFEHLIYPVPSGGGLGIHATNDLGGKVRFGPDVSWVESIDYTFDESRRPKFVAAIMSYYPGLDESKLVPAYTGIRPKLHGAGEPATDFVIQGVADHGVRSLVNLFGIESPGLTSCLAIGEYIKHNYCRTF